MRRGMAGNLFRGAQSDHFTAAVAPFRPHIDDIIRRLDHVEVVLDHDNRVAGINQTVQHPQQVLNIGKV